MHYTSYQLHTQCHLPSQALSHKRSSLWSTSNCNHFYISYMWSLSHIAARPPRAARRHILTIGRNECRTHFGIYRTSYLLNTMYRPPTEAAYHKRSSLQNTSILNRFYIYYRWSLNHIAFRPPRAARHHILLIGQARCRIYWTDTLRSMKTRSPKRRLDRICYRPVWRESDPYNTTRCRFWRYH